MAAFFNQEDTEFEHGLRIRFEIMVMKEYADRLFCDVAKRERERFPCFALQSVDTRKQIQRAIQHRTEADLLIYELDGKRVKAIRTAIANGMAAESYGEYHR